MASPQHHNQNEETSSPDPRWPHLHRWTAATSPVTPSQNLNDVSNSQPPSFIDLLASKSPFQNTSRMELRRGQIQAVVTKIWGRKCRIFCCKLGESTFLFHIPDESTRKWVLHRVPVWLTLKNIPYQVYSFKGIKWIASGIGEPMLTEKP
ncbi:hypothetical protein AALP_AA8G183400 [Arabis alpina]|uniref:DUF4283 domain-containing protein n=1 Tax=Arabis alpina TaxID=50452 RepID=A0A087G7U4_ARAAL|nr:hypothetical protein AALP_AA8G183400 [Arabis alpina]